MSIHPIYFIAFLVSSFGVGSFFTAAGQAESFRSHMTNSVIGGVSFAIALFCYGRAM